MAYLIEKNNGNWYVRDKSINKEFSTRTKNHEKALKILKDYEEKGETPKLVPILCSDFKEKYKEYMRALGKSDGYIVAVTSSFNELIRITRDKKLHHYITEDLDKVLLEKASKNKQTAINYKKNLNPAFKYAIREKHIKRNPLRGTIKFDKPKPEIHYFELDKVRGVLSSDLEKLLKILPQLYVDITVFAIRTGMRLSEVCFLKIKDVDTKHKTIFVRSDEVHETKSKEPRFIEMAKELVPVLQKYVKGRGREEFLFLNPNTSRRFAPDTLSHHYTEFKRKAGLHEKLSFKAFRSTYATWLLNYGASKEYLQEQLGHSSIVILERHYAKFQKRAYRGEVNKLGLDVGDGIDSINENLNEQVELNRHQSQGVKKTLPVKKI